MSFAIWRRAAGGRRDVAPGMKGHCRSATVRVAILAMRTALPDLYETQITEQRDNLPRLQDWQLAQVSRDFDGLGADEHTLEARVTLFEKHANHFLKVDAELIQRLALAVRTCEARNPTDIQPGVGVSFDDRGEVLHDRTSLTSRRNQEQC